MTDLVSARSVALIVGVHWKISWVQMSPVSLDQTTSHSEEAPVSLAADSRHCEANLALKMHRSNLAAAEHLTAAAGNLTVETIRSMKMRRLGMSSTWTIP